jgi:hypothetical protein
MLHIPQCRKIPLGASASSTTSAKLRVPSGTPLHFNGGNRFSWIRVYFGGIASPSANAGLTNHGISFNRVLTGICTDAALHGRRRRPAGFPPPTFFPTCKDRVCSRKYYRHMQDRHTMSSVPRTPSAQKRAVQLKWASSFVTPTGMLLKKKPDNAGFSANAIPSTSRVQTHLKSAFSRQVAEMARARFSQTCTCSPRQQRAPEAEIMTALGGTEPQTHSNAVFWAMSRYLKTPV